MREIAAGFIVYKKSRDGIKYLFLYHGRGYWNFPKGKLESNEKSFRAAVRELQEETGLRKTDLSFNNYFQTTDKFIYFRNRQKVFKVVTLYLAESKMSDVRVSGEHEGYGWFSYQYAIRILKHQNLRNILRKANTFLQRKGPIPNRPIPPTIPPKIEKTTS